MIIILYPVAVFDPEAVDTTPVITDSAINYRGQQYKIADIVDVEPGSSFLAVETVNGTISCTIEYRYNALLAEPIQSTDWADWTFEIEAGQVPDPIKYKPIQVGDTGTDNTEMVSQN